jgi:tetratricopeptide (TPR) repeat protein
VGVFFIVILGFAKVKAKQQAIALATASFERGRQELEQGNADEALEDFQRAIGAYPDPNIIREKAAIAIVISDGNKSLTHARDLIDQKDFGAARKVLDGIPHNDYLDAQVKTIRDDIDKREAEIKAAEKQLHDTGVPIDPMTAAEAHDYWERAKKESLDGAYADMGHAYDMLSSKGAGGADFEQLKLDYVEILKQIYVRYKRASPAKAELALEKANSILPDSIPPGGPVVAPAAGETTGQSHVKHSHASHPPSHRHHATASDLPRKQSGSPAPAASAGGSRYDEGHAEELDDAGDSLLGQNPDGAKAKYREALKYAPPDSEAANRARAGLSN